MKDLNLQPKLEKISTLKVLNGTKKGFFTKVVLGLKKSIYLTLGSAMLLLPLMNIAREIKEEYDGNNLIVDFDFIFGSIILNNRDERTAVQIYDDVINAALNVEDLEKAYDLNYNWTEQEKKDFISKFVKAMTNEAGIKVDNINYKKLDSGTLGMHYGLNIGSIAITAKTVDIDIDLLTNMPMSKTLSTVVHEIAGHAVENQNLLTNKNLSAMDKSDFKHFALMLKMYNNEIYYSVPSEIVAHTIQLVYDVRANEKFNASSVAKSALISNKLNFILSETIFNDYFENRQTTDFANITIKELIYEGIKGLYDDQIQVEDSYLFKILEYGYGEYLDLAYLDFVSYNNDFFKWELSDKIDELESVLAIIKSGDYAQFVDRNSGYAPQNQQELLEYAQSKLARKLSEVVKTIYYNPNKFDSNLVREALQLVADNIDFLTPSQIIQYQLEDISQTKQQNQTIEHEFN